MLARPPAPTPSPHLMPAALACMAGKLLEEMSWACSFLAAEVRVGSDLSRQQTAAQRLWPAFVQPYGLWSN